MTSLGLDYAFARPSGASLKAAGVVGVGRYLVTDSRGLTAAEVADYQASGIGLWLVYEGEATGMLAGSAQGVHDAQNAVARAKVLGLPDDVAIFWAADFDIAPGSTYVGLADAYVSGWNSVIPAGRRGGYGGLWYLQHVGDNVDFRWECGSTSFRHGVTEAEVDLDLQQTTQTPPIADTDHNNVFKTGSFVGQNGDDMPLTSADTAAVATAVTKELSNSASFLAVVVKGVHDSVVGILRAEEFELGAAPRLAQLNTVVGATTITSAVEAAVSKLNVSVDATTLAAAIVEHISLTEK